MYRLALIFFVAVLAFAANVKLYLKDGGFHIVREYQVLPDRVKYYSVERGDWEEIPLELVDLAKTRSEVESRQESVKEETAAEAAEEKAEREMRREIESVPEEKGAYLIEGGRLKTIPAAEVKFVNSKGRSVLKVLSPVPIIPGKTQVEVDGEHSKNVVDSDRPEFYFRLTTEERFGILRMPVNKGSKGKVRLVETLAIIPVSKEIIEQQDMVEIFRKQVGDDLYKIWPTKPLEPGEYAVVEYTEGKGTIQVWDFSYAKK